MPSMRSKKLDGEITKLQSRLVLAEEARRALENAHYLRTAVLDKLATNDPIIGRCLKVWDVDPDEGNS